MDKFRQRNEPIPGPSTGSNKQMTLRFDGEVEAGHECPQRSLVPLFHDGDRFYGVGSQNPRNKAPIWID